MPETFSGEGYGYNCDTLLMRFRSWVNFQEARLPDDAAKVETFKYVLSDTAILWWNALVATGNVPATLNELRDVFFCKVQSEQNKTGIEKGIKRMQICSVSVFFYND